jgi:DNA-binding PadR family transcriptional regulator
MSKKTPKDNKLVQIAETLIPTDAGPIDSVDPKPYSDESRRTRARERSQLMQAINDRSEGAWRPSPGSVYPALQQLQDEGLVRIEADDAKRGVAHLTPAGEQYVAEFGTELTQVWDSSRTNDTSSLREAVHGIGLAARQVNQVGEPEQIAAAQALLASTQRQLYAILATDPSELVDLTEADQAE